MINFHGPVVDRVKAWSVLKELMFEGDIIVAVDGWDISEWSAESLLRLLVNKCKLERKTTVLRMEELKI